MTILGTRPEVIRLSRVIAKLDSYTEHVLIHTGQNYDYELNEVFFKEMGIRKPDMFLDVRGVNSAEIIGNVIIAADKAIDIYKPDTLLILGDTNSCISAISAKRRKIPIFHMEAGNRCFDFRVPEEINRKIVDHLSDINLTYSDIAREYLLREGFPPDQIIKTGSPLYEVIDYYLPKIHSSIILSKLKLTKDNFFLVSCHREENVDSPERLRQLLDILNHLVDRYKIPVIVSTHPRTRNRLNELKLDANSAISFLKPFGYFDYVNLQINAKAVLSDSGTITEEASILNFPAINLREVHERPEGFEEAAVMFAGFDKDRIIQCLELLSHQPRGATRVLQIVKDYEAKNVSEKVIRIMLSYTNFINQKVWRK